jgi:hypothetical protein
MSKLLATESFTDVSQLEDVLHYILVDSGDDTDEDYPLILVEDANGNPLNNLSFYENTLTDSSKTYKVVLGRTGA